MGTVRKFILVAGFTVACTFVTACKRATTVEMPYQTAVKAIPATNSTNPVTVSDTDSVEGFRATVHISAKGFEPQSITVPVGTTVTWRNDDEALHRIVGDPTDERGDVFTLNDEIDLQTGDEYLYTFLRKGAITYRDAYVTALSGTITVE